MFNLTLPFLWLGLGVSVGASKKVPCGLLLVVSCSTCCQPVQELL